MFRRFSANFAVFSVFADTVIIAGCLHLSSVLRAPLSRLSFVQFISEPVRLPVEIYFLFPLLWVGIFLLFSVYDGRKNLRLIMELTSLTVGSLLAMISMAGILFLTYRDISRFLFIFFVGTAYCMLAGWRLVYRLILRSGIAPGRDIHKVLILGAGKTGRVLQGYVKDNVEAGLRFVGFLDDDAEKQTREDVIGSLDEARKVIEEKQVDDVVIALPRSAHDRLNNVVSELHDLPVRVWVIPDYFSLTLHQATIEEFAGIPLMDLRAPALTEYQRMMKRAFDVVICLFSMPFVLPIMGGIALAIKLDSPGPVFYTPTRVGENGRLFRMYKFRTMVLNAEMMQPLVETRDENGNLVNKRRNDPRVTRVGRFIRRTSLDELPQLFNVIEGSMSLIGPRPEQPYLVKMYDLWQRKRFAVPQGMTGWWQVNGRSDKPMHLHTEEDLYYVQHYSIWLDLMILFKTVWAVLRGKGAY
jgi:exopolysaccharide biosynthesis polyprenyl glycosylphosphotransferase